MVNPLGLEKLGQKEEGKGGEATRSRPDQAMTGLFAGARQALVGRHKRVSRLGSPERRPTWQGFDDRPQLLRVGWAVGQAEVCQHLSVEEAGYAADLCTRDR
jgi:hypothetical protein